MTIATATISGQFVLPDLTAGRMVATIEANADAALVTYSGMVIGGKILIPIQADGTATVTVPKIPQAGLLPTSADVQWHVNVKAGNDSRDYYFTLTADTTWDQVLTPSSVAAPTLGAIANAALTAALAAQSSATGSATAAASSATAAAGSAASATAIADPTGGYAHQIGNSNGSDDTTNLNGLLNTAGHYRGTPGQNYQISAPLVLKSGTTLDMTGSTITLKAGSNCNMVQNYAATHPTATASDGATTSGSNVVTTSLGASATVGQMLVVGAAGGTGADNLVGLISAKTSTTITLTTLDGRTLNAVATGTGKAVALYTRDTDITIKGGWWDRGANGPNSGVAAGSGTPGHSFFFKHVDRLFVDIPKATSTAGISFIWPTSVRDFYIALRECDVVRTGVQLVGPAYKGRIEIVSGHSNDDLVNLCGNVYPDQTDTCGDVVDVSVGRIVGRAVGGSAFKLNAGPTQLIDQISVDSITGTGAIGFWIGDDTLKAQTTGGTYGTVDVGNLTLVASSKTVLSQGPDIQHLRIRRAKFNTTAGAVGNMAFGVGAGAGRYRLLELGGLHATIDTAAQVAIQHHGAVIDHMLVHSSRLIDSPNTYFISSTAAGSIDILTMREVTAKFNVTGTGTGFAYYQQTTATVRQINVNNCRFEGAGAVLRTNAAAVVNMTLSEVYTLNNDRLLNIRGVSNITLDDVTCVGNTSTAIFVSGGTLVVAGGGFTTNGSTFERAASESISVKSPRIPTSVSLLALNIGDMANNTNSGLSSGVGPAVCIGTQWVNMATGRASAGIPTAAVGAAAGTGASTSAISGSDTGAALTVTTGTATTTGALFTVTLAAGYSNVPKAIAVTPLNAAAAACGVHYVTAISATQFTVNVPTAPAASTATLWAFAVTF